MSKKKKKKQKPVELFQLIQSYEEQTGFDPDKDKLIDGQPSIIRLDRFENDHTLSGNVRETCCDCGLTHLHQHFVFVAPNEQWYLGTRSYRVPNKKKDKKK